LWSKVRLNMRLIRDDFAPTPLVHPHNSSEKVKVRQPGGVRFVTAIRHCGPYTAWLHGYTH
jgi:hypothetical protein